MRPARVAARVALAVAVTLCIVVAGCPSVALARQAGPGDDGVGPSSLARLETVPPIEGVRISLDGAVVVTGPDGSALAAVAERRDVATRVEVLDERVAISEDTRARFSRIFGGGGDSVRIAYDVDYRVRLNFADDSGALIPPGDITRVRLKSTLGEVRDIDADDVPWLQGTRVVSSRSGPEVRDIQWSIEDVVVAGSSVVHRAWYRFLPREHREVDVEVLFFDAVFRVQDALFGHPVGSRLVVEAPDGTVTEHPIGADGVVELVGLPRGEYRVLVEGGGPTLGRPVSITRDQNMRLKFYTWLDIVAGLLAVVAFLVVPFGVRAWLKRRRRRSTDETSPVVVSAPEEVGRATSGAGARS